MSNKNVGRPRKKKSEIRDVDLRIPVTKAEKRRVMKGYKGDSFSSWARQVLFKAIGD